MRNRSYRLSQEAFGRVLDLSRQDGFVPKEMIRLLEEHIGRLETTLRYANDAVRGLKRRKLAMYKLDKASGVLEEEIVLGYFLEEMISSSQFLKKRLETDLNIRAYRHRVKRFQSQTPGGSGFLANILESLEAMMEAEFIDIEKLFGIMAERYRIGDKLFEVILKKAGKAEVAAG